MTSERIDTKMIICLDKVLTAASPSPYGSQ